MLKFNFDNSKWTNSNQKEFQFLENIIVGQKVDTMTALQQLGVLNDVQEIAKAPDAWLMHNGPQQEFLLWVTVADEVQPTYDRGYVGTLFFKWTCVEWVKESGFSFVKKDGQDFTDEDMHDYVMRYGFTTDSLGEVLQDKEEWENHRLRLNVQNGDPLVDNTDIGKTQWLNVAVDSSYFHRVSRGVQMTFRIPLKRMICLHPVLEDKLGRVTAMSVTGKNGNINRQKATELIDKRLRQKKLQVSKEVLSNPFVVRSQLSSDELVTIHAFGQPFALRAGRCPVVNVHGIEQKSELQQGKWNGLSRNMYAENLLKQETFSFLVLMKRIGFQILKSNGHFGVPSPDEKISVREEGYVQDAKLCLNGRMASKSNQEIEEERIWEMRGNNFILLPHKDYFLVNFGPVILCYMNEGGVQE